MIMISMGFMIKSGDYVKNAILAQVINLSEETFTENTGQYVFTLPPVTVISLNMTQVTGT